MAPQAAVLQIITLGERGTGALIARDLVVTAGHVVYPRGGELATPDQIELVTPEGARIAPAAVLCHPGWSHGFHPSCDIAVLRVPPQSADLVYTPILDAAADALAVDVVGFASEDQLVAASGSVTRLADPAGYDMLMSSDLLFPSGVSGAPIVDVDDRAIGIATRSPDLPGENAPVGLVFLARTVGWLRLHCP